MHNLSARDEIVLAIGKVVKDRFFGSQLKLIGRWQPIDLSCDPAQKSIIVNPITLWYTPAPNLTKGSISHAAGLREMCLGLQPPGSCARRERRTTL
jgi:hypothetical protein